MRAERQMIHDLAPNLRGERGSYRNVLKCFLANVSCCWQGFTGNHSEFQMVTCRLLERVHKAFVFRCLRSGCVTWPSLVFYTGQVAFFPTVTVCDCSLLYIEKKVMVVVVVAVMLSDSCPKVRLLVLLLSVLSVNEIYWGKKSQAKIVQRIFWNELGLYSCTKYCMQKKAGKTCQFGFFLKCSLKAANVKRIWKKQGELMIVTHDVTAKVTSLKEKKVPQ